MYYLYVEQKFKDLKIKNVTGNNIDLYYYLNTSNPSHYIQHFCDTKFIRYTSTTDFSEVSETDYPTYIYWLGIPSANWQSLLIEHSINYTVTDDTGTGISGVTLNIYDKDDTLISTSTSDASGIFTEIILKTKEINYITGTTTPATGAEGTYHTVNRRYPFTFTLSKTGYETYTAIYSTLEDKIDSVIQLNTAIPQKITQDGEVIQVLEPELGSSSKLLEL